MQLETERLYLVPLTAAQLRLWVENIPALGQAEKTAADEVNYRYHSPWFLIRKTDRVAIGSAC